MLNMLKMDLYRMFCTRSMYVIWIVMAVAVSYTHLTLPTILLV